MFLSIGEIAETHAAVSQLSVTADVSIVPAAGEATASDCGDAVARSTGPSVEDDGLLDDYDDEDNAVLEQNDPEAFVMNQVLTVRSCVISGGCRFKGDAAPWVQHHNKPTPLPAIAFPLCLRRCRSSQIDGRFYIVSAIVIGWATFRRVFFALSPLR